MIFYPAIKGVKKGTFAPLYQKNKSGKL